MKKVIIVTTIICWAFLSNAKVINVVENGADNTGKEKCTAIINSAIEEAAEKGGGTIFFPAGEYLTGPIHMKSNITLDLEAGAHIQFSGDFDDFLPYVKIRFEGIL